MFEQFGSSNQLIFSLKCYERKDYSQLFIIRTDIQEQLICIVYSFFLLTVNLTIGLDFSKPDPNKESKQKENTVEGEHRKGDRGDEESTDLKEDGENF